MKTLVRLPKKTRVGSRTYLKTSQRISRGVVSRLNIQNVLVPIDFSSHSLEALEFAAPWLQSFGANLHLVHVSAPDAPLAGLAGMPIVLSPTASNARIRAEIKRVAEKSTASTQPAKIHIVRGDPYEQICRLAKELEIDLIVIATRGQTGLKHLVLGSTAERVVRYSPCPVLVVRLRASSRGNGVRGQSSLHIAKILVPIDFSKCSVRGLDYARTISARFGSKTILMHSISPAYYSANDEYGRYDFPELLRECERAAVKQLRELAASKKNKSRIEIDVPQTFGHAGLQICNRARELAVDLIVTSTHGRTGLKHVLLGSTAEYVVRHAPCSVLVMPNHPRPTLDSTGDKK